MAKMHEEEADIDEGLIRRRLQADFPQWADLELKSVLPWGTDNAIFRLGDDKAIRMPRVQWAVDQVEKEQRWLPELAPHLPFAIPVPLGKGSPGDGYPWEWSIYSWLDGEAASPQGVADPDQLASDLGTFVSVLHGLDATGGPLAGRHNFGRGMALATRDKYTRDAIATLDSALNGRAAVALWEEALAAEPWSKAPVWVHGDLQAGNLLMKNDRLTAVIDFGGLGVGDPACDLIIAWSLMPESARDRYRATLDVDDATWTRGRGWALSVGVIALPYYRETNPRLAETARRAISQVLGEPVRA